jgi:hypothetical protein
VDHSDSEMYIVSFFRGTGAGWGINSYNDAAGKIIDEIRQNIDCNSAGQGNILKSR